MQRLQVAISQAINAGMRQHTHERPVVVVGINNKALGAAHVSSVACKRGKPTHGQTQDFHPFWPKCGSGAKSSVEHNRLPMKRYGRLNADVARKRGNGDHGAPGEKGM